jgi:hypothetical protein
MAPRSMEYRFESSVIRVYEQLFRDPCLVLGTLYALYSVGVPI